MGPLRAGGAGAAKGKAKGTAPRKTAATKTNARSKR
jgi:hypothetical protein